MKIPSPLVSLLPVAVLVVLLFFTIRLLGADALGGGSQICLLLTTALCAALGMSRYGVSWKDIEHAIINNIAGVSSALIILLIIGALSAAWMLGGVVPMLIYYGVQIIHPKFFLVSCCVICAVVSVMTGSSWTTIATIGIALMGIGKAQGFDEGWIAGAIISGAYFGDKVSPLSDTTILASSVTDTPLFTHIRYMMYTTVPSVVISLVIFTIAGFSHEASDSSQIAVFTTGLAERFHITFWVLLVPVVTGILIARKVSSIITLFISTALAVVCMLVFQTDVLREVAGDGVSGGEVYPHVRHKLRIHAYRRESRNGVDLVQHQPVLSRKEIHPGESAAPHCDERLFRSSAELLGHLRRYLRRNIQHGSPELVLCVIIVEFLRRSYLPRNGSYQILAVSENGALDFLADYLGFDDHLLTVSECNLNTILERLAVSGTGYSHGGACTCRLHKHGISA